MTIQLKGETFYDDLHKVLVSFDLTTIANPNLAESSKAQDKFVELISLVLNDEIQLQTGIEIVYSTPYKNSINVTDSIDMLLIHLNVQEVDVIYNAFEIYVDRLSFKIKEMNFDHCTLQHFADYAQHRHRRFGIYGWAEGVPAALFHK